MFTPVSTRAASAYRQVDVETSVDGASPHHLVRLLFDALTQSLLVARAAMARGDVETKGREIGKAVRIIEEGLKASLNEQQGGEVAVNLRTVYSYCARNLTLANLKNDESKLVEVMDLMAPIADAWKQIDGATFPDTGE